MLFQPRPLARPPVLSRHRLPRPYRVLLPALALAPLPLFAVAVLLGAGFSAAVLDPRFWGPLLIGLLPAGYWWNEGVDVLPDGFIRRMHIPRRYRYVELTDWHFRSASGVLTVLDVHGETALECRAVLTGFPRLLQRIREHVGV